MFGVIKRILNLSGKYKKRLYMAFVMSFFESIFVSLPVIVVMFVLKDISLGQFTMDKMWTGLVIMLIGIVLQYLCNLSVYHLQSGTGFNIIGDLRMEIGEKLKRLPMGYFSDTNIGNITAVVTSDLTFIEMNSMQFIGKFVNAIVGAVLTAIFLFFLDRKMALIALIAYPIALLVYKKIQKLFKEFATVRQKSQVNLISSVLEYIHGISIIKAFNLSRSKFGKLSDSLEKFEKSSLEFEMKAVPWLTLYNVCFQLGAALILYFGPYYYFSGTLSCGTLLMFLVISFRIYLPIETIGATTGLMRLMDACLDRVEEIKNIPLLDEKDIDKPMSGYDMEFKNVTFSYEDREVIKNMSFKIKENTMTALVGTSGSGKTTITNLIARFWDVQKGEITIGGTNIKDMKCESILSQISMVFQNVYLFNDSIINNIKFGKPEASKEEVIQAAKKARCHEFIEQLENGYDTIIGEGGSTLSGGEKQRISIARAILKDAPIIFLDEVTASIDPENEQKIQQAINALIKDKTLIVIAHRLSTIKKADQILVIEEGKLSENGIHGELLKQEGIYADFWMRRQKARNWKFGAKLNENIEKVKEIRV